MSFILGSAISAAGVVINLIVRSRWPRLLSLMLVIFGITTACVGPMKVVQAVFEELVDTVGALLSSVGAHRGEQRPIASEALLDRLNRGAAQYRDLVDAISKLVIPVLVALVVRAGVVLTVLTRLLP